MRLNRSQTILLIVLGALTLVVYGLLVGAVVRGPRETSQVIVSPVVSPTQDMSGDATPVETSPAVPTRAPTATPAAAAPQTRYDLDVVREPEDAQLRVQRGYAYLALGAYLYAMKDFDVAIGLDDAPAEAYAGRGEAHFYRREWTAALEDLGVALAANPGLADARALHGRLLSEWGLHDPALDALRQAVELDDADPEKHIWLADALLRSGDAAAAELAYTSVLTREARSIAAHVGRAMARAEQGALDAAQADLTTAQSLVPYDPVVLNGQAWFYAWYLGGSLDEAERLAQRAIAGSSWDIDTARYLHTLGWVYYQQQRYDEAIATLEEAADLAVVEGEVVIRDIVQHLEDARQAR